MMFLLVFTSCELEPDNVEGNKSELTLAITAANSLKDSKTPVVDVAQSDIDVFTAAITDAQDVADDEDATKDDIVKALEDLAAATLTFNNSLITAETVVNILSNGAFDSNSGTGWDTSGAATFDYSTGAAVVTITATQTNPWDIPLYQMISLDASSYEFSFDYSSTIDSTIKVSVENPSYESFLTSSASENKPELTATSTVQHFSQTFQLSTAEATTKVLIMLGNAESGAVITIDNLELKQLSASQIGPVITLLGDSPMILEEGSTYSEPGATAEDNLDGTISVVAADITGTVDTAIIGFYTITYTVEDSDGNISVTTRTVEVIESLVNPAATTTPTAAELNNAFVVYTDATLPASATQIDVINWVALEGGEHSTRLNVTEGGDNMWAFTLTGGIRYEMYFDSVNLTGKRVHFDLYAYGNSAAPAADGGVTPNEFKVEFKSSDSNRNTYQEVASSDGQWTTVDLLLSDCNFATANADLSAITSITINQNPSNVSADESGFYIDNLYFY